jgi:hypothetical protein
MDFIVDTLADGRGFRTLNVVDDFTRECVAIEVDRSLPGLRVVRMLDRLAETLGLAATLVMDNGPEFNGRALDNCGACMARRDDRQRTLGSRTFDSSTAKRDGRHQTLALCSRTEMKQAVWERSIHPRR